MRRFLGVVVSVVAALGLVAGPAMAAQVLVLSDAQLAGVWAGVVDGNAVAVDHSNAATTGGEILNADLDIDDHSVSTDVDVDVDVSILSNVQNGANGINLSNALLSQVAQQSNVANVSDSSATFNVSAVIQLNNASF